MSTREKDIYRDYEMFRDTIASVVAGVNVSYRELHDLRDEIDDAGRNVSEEDPELWAQLVTLRAILTGAIQHRNCTKNFD